MKIVEFSPVPGRNVRMVGYLHEQLDRQPQREKRPCALIYPGGAYRFLSPREADPIAFRFFAEGYQTFLLSYSVTDNCPAPLLFEPLLDGSAAVMTIREHSGEYHIDPHQIAVCGFSAGGHAAASLGVLWNSPRLRERLDTGGGQNRPDAMILCYPVITSGEFAHRESLRNLTGDDPGELAYFSLENQVTSEAVPAFLWHTVTDEMVPVENSLMLASALHRAGVSVECHFYAEGPHGISLSNPETAAGDFPYVNSQNATWFPLALGWLDRRFGWQR